MQSQLKLDLVKSIGDAVFQSFGELQRDPPNLILGLRGIGRRFVRRKKIHDWLIKLERTREAIVAGDCRKDLKQTDEEAIKLRRILDWYDEFTAKRLRIKTLRNEYPTPVEAPVQQKEVLQAGKNDPGEYKRIPTREP